MVIEARLTSGLLDHWLDNTQHSYAQEHPYLVLGANSTEAQRHLVHLIWRLHVR